MLFAAVRESESGTLRRSDGIERCPVCTDSSNPDVVVMKSAKEGV
jgi:hypothetical protein